MQPTINSITPNSAAPGDAITILGSGFEAGASVQLEGMARNMAVDGAFVSAGELRVIVPDSFDGLAATLGLSVINPDGEVSAPSRFDIQAWPSVEPVQRLCSLGALKLALGIGLSEAADDTTLLARIDMASAQLIGWIGRDFGTVDVVNELRDGDDSAILTLAHTPIVSVTALTIDGQAVDPTLAKVYADYLKFEDAGEYSPRLRSSTRIFPRGCQNISVSYRAGYARIPREVSDACVFQVIFLQNTLAKQGIQSETNQVANATTTYSDANIAPEAKRLANRFRRARVAIV
jgi:hypothetical protein